MTLGEYIQLLKKFDPNLKLKVGLGNPHSWRGRYEELAFEPKYDMTIGEMLEVAEDCIGSKFDGWKGGEYWMFEETLVHIDHEGVCTFREDDNYFQTWLQGVIGTALFIHIKNA